MTTLASMQCATLMASHISYFHKILSNQSDPLDHFDYFGVSKLFTVKTLFDSRMHLGHTVRSLQPHMAPFVFGTRY